MRIFRTKWTKAIPPHAERFTRSSQQWVRWYYGTKLVEGRVSPSNPDRVIVYSRVWLIEYTDARGNKRRVKGYTDLAATRQKASQLEAEVCRQQAGILPLDLDPISIEEAMKKFEQHLRNRETTEHHRLCVLRCCAEILEVGNPLFFKDLRPELVLQALTQIAASRKKFSQGTRQHYIKAIKQFSKFSSVEFSILDPLVKLSPQTVRSKTINRRALSIEEFNRFIEVTRQSKHVQLGFTGAERAILYLTAASTGLRAGELAQLQVGSFDLGEVPSVVIESAAAKNRTRTTLPIPDFLALELRQFFEGKKSTDLAFKNRAKTHWVKRARLLVRKDLAEAGIKPTTEQGSYDFHSFRVQFITDLARAGISLQEAQRLARLSSLGLLLSVYTKLGISDLVQSVNRLRKPTSDPT